MSFPARATREPLGIELCAKRAAVLSTERSASSGFTGSAAR